MLPDFHRLRARVSVGLVLTALSLAQPATVAAQTGSGADITGLSLEELLNVTVISAASKFPQEIREAPSSVTVITADDIRRFGYRTLSEALRSVRGFYATYDRNYSYVGMRGFARPGDYNTRMLLLLDGQRINDGTYDMAPIGTDFPLDMSLIDRIEVIRGPGSSLYGTNAFFAVVNVVTRTGGNRPGLHAETYAGSLGTGGATAAFGHLFAGKRELLVSGSAYRSAGQRQLTFPEFASEDDHGVVRDLDDDETRQIFGSWSAGRFKARAGVGYRQKQVPTASYDTIFGDAREVTEDTRRFLNLTYDGALGRHWSGSGRVGYDDYEYLGGYPTDFGADGIGVVYDGASTRGLTGELTVRRRFARAHLLTLGAEVRRQLRSNQWGADIYGPSFSIDAPSTNAGVYAQDEVRFSSWLIANAGLRVDRFPTFGARVTPRVGLVWLPRQQTALKVLHGWAFRAPNAYERSYYPDQGAFALSPERLRSTEVAWEEFLTPQVRTSVTAFAYSVTDLIGEARVDPESAGASYFVNAGRVRAAGLDAEVEARLASGLSLRVSHTYTEARGENDARLTNSPANLSKLALQVPVSRFVVAMEGQSVGSRLTLDGTRLGRFFAANLVVSSPSERRVGITFGVYNLFDQQYSDPGAEEHLQQSIAQDGRSILARVQLAF